MFLIPRQTPQFHNPNEYRLTPKHQNIPQVQNAPSAARVGAAEGPEVRRRRCFRGRNPIAEIGSRVNVPKD